MFCSSIQTNRQAGLGIKSILAKDTLDTRTSTAESGGEDGKGRSVTIGVTIKRIFKYSIEQGMLFPCMDRGELVSFVRRPVFGCKWQEIGAQNSGTNLYLNL